MVTDNRPGKANIHCTVPLSTPTSRRLPGRRIDAEMRIDDGAKFGRHVEAAHQRRRGIGRNRKNDRVIGGEHDGFLAEIERFDPVGGKTHGAQLMFQAHAGAALLQACQRRLDQRRSQSIARNQRPAGPAAGGERFPDHRARELRRSFRGIDIERGQQERLDQPPIERSFAGNDFADALARARP